MLQSTWLWHPSRWLVEHIHIANIKYVVDDWHIDLFDDSDLFVEDSGGDLDDDSEWCSILIIVIFNNSFFYVILIFKF